MTIPSDTTTFKMLSPGLMMKYDGKGRRIQKAISNTGSWDCTFKYYYDNDSCIEERNGSDYVIKENVWGTNYIDELVQTKAESDGTFTSSALSGTDSVFYACQDANYNVLGIVSNSGALIERYEYTPYGQRKTFFSAGSNDGQCYAPTMSSRRASSSAAWGKNEFGHQGLMHDEEIDLVYNRARHLHPGLQRFVQRDPLGSVNGQNLYQDELGRPTMLRDPNGTKTCDRTDGQCCNDYQASPEWQANPNKADTQGITLCCDGRKVACATWNGVPAETNSDADAIRRSCTTEHECSHFDDIVCPRSPNPSVTRPHFADQEESHTDYQECIGHTIALRCMQEKINNCKDQACRDAMVDLISKRISTVMHYCQGFQPQPNLRGCGKNRW